MSSPSPSDDERGSVLADLRAYFDSPDVDVAPRPDDDALEAAFFDFEPLEAHEGVDGYWVDEPYAYVSIRYAPEEGAHYYHVLEPERTERVSSVYADLEPTLRRVLLDEEFERDGAGIDAFLARLREVLSAHTASLAPIVRWKLAYYFRRDFVGFGRLDPLTKDPNIEDISCNGADLPVYVYHDEYGDVETRLRFESEALDALTMRLAQRAGRHVSASYPLLTTTLPDGSRLQVTLGDDVVTRGSNFTIRKFREEPFSPIDLLALGTFSVEQIVYLWLAVEYNRSILFVGPTASGKTTSMNALAGFIPPDEKVVSIEQTREISLPHDNWIADVTRESGLHGSEPEIGMYQLLDEALHQRPNYLLVGEIRTDPDVVLAFFQAIGTGHDGFTTFHAESSRDAVRRLSHHPLDIPSELVGDIDLICAQHLLRQRGANARRCRQLTEVETPSGAADEPPTLRDVFEYSVGDDSFEQVAASHLLADIAADEGWSHDELQSRLRKRRRVLAHLLENDVTDFEAVTRVLFRFARTREDLLDSIDVQPAGTAIEVADERE